MGLYQMLWNWPDQWSSYDAPVSELEVLIEGIWYHAIDTTHIGPYSLVCLYQVPVTLATHWRVRDIVQNVRFGAKELYYPEQGVTV